MLLFNSVAAAMTIAVVGSPSGIFSGVSSTLEEGNRPVRTTVPFSSLGRSPLITVTVWLNGSHQARFLFDTGAQQSYLTVEMASTLGLSLRPAISDDGKPFKLSFQPNVPAKMVRVSRVSIGALPIDNIPFIVVKAKQLPTASLSNYYSEQLDGVLGLNLLQFFGILVDPARKEITIDYPGRFDSKQLDTLGFAVRYSAPMKVDDSTASVTATLNQVEKSELIIDSASEFTAIEPDTAKRLRLKPIGVVKDQRSAYGDFQVRSANLNALTIGTLSLDNQLIDYPTKANRAVPARLGLDILSRYKVLLDFPAATIYFSPKERAQH
jgi:hypothetical protein